MCVNTVEFCVVVVVSVVFVFVWLIVIEFTHFCQEAKPLGWWPVTAALESLN